MSWVAGHSEADTQAMLLTPRDAGEPWQGMRLVLGRGEMRLEDVAGETLASASDLPALLDAVDGGVAEPAAARGRVLAGLAAAPVAPLLGIIG